MLVCVVLLANRLSLVLPCLSFYHCLLVSVDISNYSQWCDHHHRSAWDQTPPGICLRHWSLRIRSLIQRRSGEQEDDGLKTNLAETRSGYDTTNISSRTAKCQARCPGSKTFNKIGKLYFEHPFLNGLLQAKQQLLNCESSMHHSYRGGRRAGIY